MKTGNRPWIEAECTAPNVTTHLTDASTAITFVMHKPDGTDTTPISSPHADIAGPVAGTKSENGVTLTTTTWYWKVPLLVLPGNYVVRWTSTAGLIAQDSIALPVDQFAPFSAP